MAAYTPATLRTVTAITAAYVKVIDPSSVTAVMRTFVFNVDTTAHSVFAAQGTGAAGTLFVNNHLLTANVEFLVNTWIVLEDASFVEVKADSVASNAPNFGAWGYNYA